MKFILSFFLMTAVLTIINAQNLVPIGAIGEFTNATAFSYSPKGVFYVTDSEENEITKLDTNGRRIEKVGGYGWSNQNFDYPADVFAWTLRVFVADKNNHRIQILDKDLNFIAEFKPVESETQLYTFSYPTCVSTSNQGDYYILDSDNARILKYDINGYFLQEIGNYDAGDFALSNPRKFAVSPAGKIFVVDDNGLIVFDQYGMGLGKLDTGIEAENINITFNYLTLTNESQVQMINIPKISNSFGVFDLNEEAPIVEAIVNNGKLYVLTETKITIFKIFPDG